MIDLPTWPEPQSAEPFFIDAGGWQLPSISAGTAIRIDRLGDRHGLRVKMPPMKFNDPANLAHARVWISRLKRGVAEGVRIKFPQPDFTLPANAVVRTAAAAQATLLPVTGAAGFTYREGTFFALVNAATGKRYLHSLNADAVMDGAGAGTLSVHPRLRVNAVVGWQLLFSPPAIEGRVTGDRQSWSLEMARTVGLEFEIEEFD